MKKFIKGRWFPVIAAIAIVVLASGVVLTMMLFGWRFTYAPELETSWDAISAVAAWVGVISSFVAIWFAIQVPKIIVEKQNKIALFEKRYAVYDVLLHCISFSDSIKTEFDLSNSRALFIVSFSYQPIIDRSHHTLLMECTKYAMDAKNKFDTASFLFDCDTEKYTNSIISALFDVVYYDADSKTRESFCKKYQSEVQTMRQELLPEIKKELSLLK